MRHVNPMMALPFMLGPEGLPFGMGTGKQACKCDRHFALERQRRRASRRQARRQRQHMRRLARS